jgi:hypothetical protein
MEGPNGPAPPIAGPFSPIRANEDVNKKKKTDELY